MNKEELHELVEKQPANICQIVLKGERNTSVRVTKDEL